LVRDAKSAIIICEEAMNRLNKQGERMTNKMPVVGKRIVEAVIADFTDRRGLRQEWENIDKDIQNEIQEAWLKKINLILEKELPEDNSQKQGEVQEAASKDFMEGYNAGWNDFGFKKDYRFKEPADNEPKANETPNPVDFKNEEVNEVDRALKELKEEINYLENKGIIDFEAYLKLRTRSQILVDALEAEKTVMSKLEPKINIKEEHVDPVSIWKDVSELPDDFKGDVIIKDRDGYVKNDWLQGASKPHFGKDFLKYKWCYLHDLINSFEQMQKDIEELKRK